jgi:hypothetical protein
LRIKCEFPHLIAGGRAVAAEEGNESRARIGRRC